MLHAKRGLAGLLSGILTLGVLVGNTILSAFSEASISAVSPSVITEVVSLPVLRYQKISQTPMGADAVTPTQLAEDLAYLQKKGYQTVSAQQVKEFFTMAKPLPSKAVLLTFDGGFRSVYEEAFTLLQEYEACAVVSVVGKYTDLSSYHDSGVFDDARLSWIQLNDMVTAGVIEAATQSYEISEIEQGLIQKPNQTLQQYREMIQQDLHAVNEGIKQATGMETELFACAMQSLTDPFMQTLGDLGFRMIFTNQQSINLLSRSAYRQNQPVVLNRFCRPGDIATAQWFADIGIK